ncbi:LysR family transcriptional regulator [Caulobacter segnis]|nr:LysR family transcriptional regulator [Caulobacter segnis]
MIGGITVFVAVAQTGSYAGAAERMGLTRSGVGKAVARLEHRMGRRLFDRTSRALKLTDEGRAFVDEVVPLLERLHVAAAPSRPDEIRGRLRVSSDSAFGAFLLAPSLPQLVARHPRLKVDLVIRDRVDNLLADGFDVAVRFGEPEHPGLVKQPVLESRLITCASRIYLSGRDAPTSPQALLGGHVCVNMIDDASRRPHGWDFLRADGAEHTIAPDCNVTINDASSLLSAARAGFGVVRLLDFMVEAELRSGTLVEILPEWNERRRRAYVYAPAQSHASPSLIAFTEFVRSMARDKTNA